MELKRNLLPKSGWLKYLDEYSLEYHKLKLIKFPYSSILLKTRAVSL